ncbi:MAG TPA: hypothetical protein P5256_00425 [Beijerinckiaceae bacterium]|nr:hypothetical protein [Rhodoblastus sp.]MCC2107227.1 hypothetical protein [Hyphomicrobiales bacterium]MCO5086708.1 hypothetical protein [Methylobacteriaceae bacterium]HPG04954.1 hypothetical protein [Rhodoblastus sp.]HRY01561.1 hypothetical protein [Beijerinckiaceae bacterium]
MGEYVWTVLKIGGAATQPTLEKLQELLDEEFGGGDNETDVVMECVTARSLIQAGGQRNYGNVDEILAFCQDHNLTVWASWDAAPGCFDAGIQYWKPGMIDVADASSNDDGEPCLTVDQLRTKLAEGATLEQVIDELALAESAAVPPIELIAPVAVPA